MRARLRRHGVARLQITVIVIGTGLSGFLLSAALLRVGVTSMPLRYGVALAGAYGVFLLLIRGWVELHRRRIDVDESVVDLLPDIGGGGGGGVNLGEGGDFGGGGGVDLGEGGDFGGGGASGGWHASSPETSASRVSSGEAAHSGAGVGGGGVADALDLDEGWIIVVPLVMLFGSLIAAFVLIWSAPGLLAELAVDVLLVSSLYRRLKSLDRRSWLLTAVRKTWIPALLVAVLLVAGGFVLEAVVPEARSMGDILRRF
jgi:hypothetical protein